MNSPLLEQSRNAIRIAEQKEKIAKSDLLPKVALVAAENFDGPILFELPPIDKNLNVWYVGVGVKYSLQFALQEQQAHQTGCRRNPTGKGKPCPAGRTAEQ